LLSVDVDVEVNTHYGYSLRIIVFEVVRALPFPSCLPVYYM